jgi:Putative undecaprenyl diphosphate synthase
VCAPYTSREEITNAIRRTVVDYNQPIRPKLKRPFSESRIARTIRAQQLSTVSEQEELKSNTPAIDIAKDIAKEEDFNYRPLSPESEATFNRMTTIIARNMVSLTSDLEPSPADSLIRGAADEILVLLKEPMLSREEKQTSINQFINTTIANEDYAELQELADSIIDFSPPTSAPDASPNHPSTEFSTSPTLNFSATSHDALNHPHNYPDPETITEETLSANMYTGLDTPPLDILIRTSGVERLSDFMLWQSHQDTEVVFLKCLWPELDLWQFFPVLLEWQWRRRKEGNGDERLSRKGTKVA